MGQPLDIIKIKNLIEPPVTVNTDFETDSIDISDREAEFSVQMDYDGGSSVDMEVALEVSNDNVTFVAISDSVHNITDNDGTSFFDVEGTGAGYLRLSITVTTGSIDLQQVVYKAKRRH